MHPPSLLTFVCWVLASSSASAASFAVTLKVVDDHHRPVAKAEAALFWNDKNGTMTTASDRAAVTDTDGMVALHVDNWNEKRPVLVFSADRRLGGIVGVSKADEGQVRTVLLRPTVRVKGKVHCNELPGKLPWVNTLVMPDGFRPYFTQDISTSASFAFVLPAGKYRFQTYGRDIESVDQTITLHANQLEHDLGSVLVKAAPFARMRGKTAPEWTVADARGVKRNIKLADFRGKWVYIDFWGFW